MIPFLEPVPSSLSDVKIALQNILEIHATPITFNAICQWPQFLAAVIPGKAAPSYEYSQYF